MLIIVSICSLFSNHAFCLLTALCHLLYPDRGISPNTTGAADGCKSSEELYYKLEQGLSSHNGEGAPSESGKSFLYCIAGEAGSEA